MIYRFRVSQLGKGQKIIFVDAENKAKAEQILRKNMGGIMQGREYDESLDGAIDSKEIIVKEED